MSTQVHVKATKVAERAAASASTNGIEHTNGNGSNIHHDNNNHSTKTSDNGLYDTKVKDGTAKRNIVRKKTADKDSGHFNSVHKKYGGHGKSQWQDSMMDPSYAIEIPIDEKDPIYDEAEDLDRYILVSSSGTTNNGNGTLNNQEVLKRRYDPNTSRAIYGPLLTLSEFKVQLVECIKEYFDSCDTDEVIRTVQELGCPEYYSEIVKKAISYAMDMGPRERELVSRLLSCLHPNPMSLEELQAGFVILLDGMDDLSKDVPDAKVRNFPVFFISSKSTLYVCKLPHIIYFIRSFFSFRRQWQLRLLRELLWMRYYPQHFYRNRIIVVQAIL
jgi:hypothetical protein